MARAVTHARLHGGGRRDVGGRRAHGRRGLPPVGVERAAGRQGAPRDANVACARAAPLDPSPTIVSVAMEIAAAGIDGLEQAVQDAATVTPDGTSLQERIAGVEIR